MAGLMFLRPTHTKCYLHRAEAHRRHVLHDHHYTVAPPNLNTKVVFLLIVIILYIRVLLAIAPTPDTHQIFTLPPSQNPPIHRRPQMGW